MIVFGYPGDKYSVTVDYFKSLGDSTDADPNTEIVNCFRIGYHDAGDAMRAVRKNGEILGGSWMVGAKWAVSLLDTSESPLLDALISCRIPHRQKPFWANQSIGQVSLQLRFLGKTRATQWLSTNLPLLQLYLWLEHRSDWLLQLPHSGKLE